ncbi:hypothetical protein FRC03_008533 [Tulasnella sp. 419]|nr:hypothetical protein FRC03_008533 [Tulasnella sp. 419]
MSLDTSNKTETADSLLTLSSTSGELSSSLDKYDDIATWVNDLLDGNGILEGASQESTDGTSDLTLLDSKVQFLVTRLDIAAQDTSSKLEESIDEISRNLPRLAYDLQFMRESALTLQRTLSLIETVQVPSSVPAESSPNDEEVTTKSVLERLHFLDAAKTALEKSHAVLREAEAWSGLDSEITSLLSSQSYAQAASRLSEASKSLSLFSNTPEYETRRALMISLQNQLEAALSSALVAAINKKDVSACKNYYGIFSDIQREVEFRNYYYGSRRKGLVDTWSNTRLKDCDGYDPSSNSPESEAAEQDFNGFLKTFFADFITLLTEERSYATSIFPDPQQTLSAFVQSILDALNPSLGQRLSAMSEYYGSTALTRIIQAFKVAEEFGVAVDRLIDSAGYMSSFSQSATGDDKRPMSRRTSKRMSLSRRLGGRSSSISGPQGLGGPVGGTGGWEPALFEPFVDLQSDYANLEKRHLDEQLKKAVGSSPQPSGSDAEGSKILRERSAVVFDMANDALSRCMDFTHGYGAVGLINAVDHAFSTLLEATKAQVLEKQPTRTTTKGDMTDGFDELDYTSEDLAAFQQSLHLLETCRAMKDRLKAVDAKFKKTIYQFATMVQLSKADPLGLYISGTIKGEVQLLIQSTLNSVELNTLLDDLLKDSQVQPLATPSSGGPGASVDTFGSTENMLLKGAAQAISTFTRATQVHLQNIILSPLLAPLSSYPSLSWASQQRPKPRAGVHELQMPTFSLSQTPTMQRVAEGLLNLPRLFEVYADDDALAFSIETLPFVDVESLKALLASESAEAKGQPESPKTLRRLSSGSNPNAAAPLPPPTFVLTPDMVSSTWLSSLNLTLLAHFTRTVLPSIQRLSKDGAAQLASDLGYLSRIVRTMNVEWEDLEKWRELSEVKDEEGKKRWKESGGSSDGDSPLKLIAKMRGWTEG